MTALQEQPISFLDLQMKNFLKKNREIIAYLFFGVVTTAVSMGVYFAILAVAEYVLGVSPSEARFNAIRLLAQILQWIAGVLVAFYTNKKWVFTDAEKGRNAGMKQFFAFSGSRVGTYFIEVVINLGVIALLEHLNYRALTFNLIVFSIVLSARLWAKVVSSVVVVISNYFISKWLVFKKN